LYKLLLPQESNRQRLDIFNNLISPPHFKHNEKPEIIFTVPILINGMNPALLKVQKVSWNERPRRKRTVYPTRIFLYNAWEITGNETLWWE